jgi:hypothetical protein
MSNVTLVSFSTTVEDIGYPDLELYQLRLHRSARRFGINNIDSWTRARLLKTDFYRKHIELLGEKKGAGYWVWKPFIIHQALMNSNSGDYVIYADCTSVFNSSPDILLQLCKQNNGFFLIAQDSFGRNASYTKRDAFVLLNCDTPFYHDAPMTEAFFQIYQKNEETMKFVEEYLNCCLNRKLVTDDPNTQGLPNIEGFVTHKHDMSILSLLRLKHKIDGFRNPSQWGNHQKLDAFKVQGEWLHAPYREPMENSPYGTVVGWRANQEDVNRPLSHYLNPAKVIARIRRLIGR